MASDGTTPMIGSLSRSGESPSRARRERLANPERLLGSTLDDLAEARVDVDRAGEIRGSIDRRPTASKMTPARLTPTARDWR
jgi:hypothetical protein